MSRGRTAGNRNQGAKWISRATRWRCYERDGMVCVWCGRTCVPALGDDRRPTLDHLIPRAAGGTNVTQNLVTACMQCNRARGDRPVFEYIAEHAHIQSYAIVVRVMRAVTTPLQKATRCKPA